jgi:hypothetical protein
MQMKPFILLFFSLLSLITSAQNNFCETKLTEQQLVNLRNFQQKLELGQVNLQKKAIQYVPLKVHIIGNQKGIGYYQVKQLMQTLCELNERFIPSGFHFYLADSISYINDDELFVGNSEAIWMRSEDYKLQGAVNVFFHGVGTQWCGVYFGGVDVVFIKNSCQGPNGTTLTHELGHFFGLPHTFSGWEGDNTPGSIEKIDKSNCRNAGDGFCDTKADYVSQRWGCPLSWNLKDPNNVVFKPDSSIYMSYSSDNCQSRFSTEQMLSMQSDLQQRGIAKGIADTRSLPAPNKLLPAPNQTQVNAKNVRLQWNAVEGAFGYHLQIARFGSWEYLNVDQIIHDTTALVQLYGEWPYAWRIKAFTAANTCSSFGTVDTFTTYELPAGMQEISLLSGVHVYPNPVKAGDKILLQSPEDVQIQVFNLTGALVYAQEVSKDFPFQCSLTLPGLYFISVRTNQGFQLKRLLVE